MQFIQKNTLVLGLIALAFLVGGGIAIGMSTSAANKEAQVALDKTTEAESPAGVKADIDEPGDVDLVDDSDANDSEEDSDEDEVPMVSQSGTISEARAIEIATATYKGNGTRTDVELEMENGVLVYGLEFTEKDGNEVDVKINARTGAIVLIEDDKTDGEQDDD